jgi:hypothetical protein
MPAIPYPGGKARLAKQIISFLPREGRTYLEPLAGATVTTHPRKSQEGVALWRDDRLAREAARSLHEWVVTEVALTELDVVLRSGADWTRRAFLTVVLFSTTDGNPLTCAKNNPNEEKLQWRCF